MSCGESLVKSGRPAARAALEERIRRLRELVHTTKLAARSGAGAARESLRVSDNPKAGYVYKVHVHTDQSAFLIGGHPRSVQSGMTVQADITTDRRRVIEFFLSPVIKYLDEGLQVR